MTSDVVWMIDGIHVVWSPKYAVYEVWQRVEQDGETVLWDCVADTPDQEEAIDEAKAAIGATGLWKQALPASNR